MICTSKTQLDVLRQFFEVVEHLKNISIIFDNRALPQPWKYTAFLVQKYIMSEGRYVLIYYPHL